VVRRVSPLVGDGSRSGQVMLFDYRQFLPSQRINIVDCAPA